MHNRTPRRDFLALGLSLPAAALLPTKGPGPFGRLGSCVPRYSVIVPPRQHGQLMHAKQDLVRVLDAARRMGIAPPIAGGHARMLRRALGAYDAGRLRAARSLLGIVLSHARSQGMSGLLAQDQTAALRMALSHVLEEAPGWQFDKFGDAGVSQGDFEHALTALRPRGLKHHPDSVGFGPEPTLGEETLVCPTTTDEMAWTICSDLMVVLANVLNEIPFVGWFLASLVEIMWPESNEDPWCVMQQAVEQLIDQKISDEVKTRVDGNLVGLKNVLDDYLEAADPALGNAGWYISSNWDDAESAFELYQPNFQETGYELLLLTDFAQFANMYLGLLRDGILYGESWGWTTGEVDKKKEKMAQLTSDFTAYANHWYQDGLTNLKIPTTGAHLNVLQFNTKNRYVRTMTVGVLDYVAMWPYMNPATYPDPVQVKLTREIYSDAQGTHDGYSGFPVDTTLKLPLTNLTVWGWDRIDAMKVAYGGVWGSRMGNSSGGANYLPYGINTTVGAGSPHGPLMVAYGRSGDILDAAGFKFADNFDTGMMGGQAGGGTAYTWSFQDEIVSKIQIMGRSQYYGSADAIVYGFRFADGY